MSEDRLAVLVGPRLGTSPAVAGALVAVHVLFNIVANAAFRVSARSPTWSGVLAWQVFGNLAGLITVLALTGLLRFAPLSVAYPLTTGMSVLGVQLVAARWLFQEPIAFVQWLGALLIIGGIFLVQR